MLNMIQKNGCYFEATKERFILGNGAMEVVLDASTGAVAGLVDPKTKCQFLRNETFPILLSIRKDGKTITTDQSTFIVQSHRLEETDNGLRVVFVYEYLKMQGIDTFINLRVYVQIQSGIESISVHAKIDNHGKYEISDLSLGCGGLNIPYGDKNTFLAIPTVYFGTIWPDPLETIEACTIHCGQMKKRNEIRREITASDENSTVLFGYPGQSEDGLLSGWVDYYTKTGGIGVAYLNRQEYAMKLTVSKIRGNLDIRWHHFDLSGTMMGGVYPLEPGKSFTTDTMIITLHDGDWHRMADIYRNEFESTFRNDYVDWRTTSTLAKQIDLVFHYVMVDRDNNVIIHFEDIDRDIEEKIGWYGVKPENILVWIAGQGSHGHDRGNPDFFPCNEKLGGNQAAKDMLAKLHRLGVTNILYYTHPYISDPTHANYHVPQAEIGKPFHWAGRRLGNLVCPYNMPWLKMWEESILPGFNELEGTGIQIDQAAQQFAVCQTDGHLHANGSTERLAANSKGLQSIVNVIRNHSRNPDVFIMSESAHDIQCRNMDIWQVRSGNSYASEIGRYGFPYRILLNVDSCLYSAVEMLDSFARGEIICGQLITIAKRFSEIPSDTLDNLAPHVKAGGNTLIPILRQAMDIRSELRAIHAPGFPFGFRDKIGLETSDSNCVGYVFRDESGVTILCYAKDAVNGVLRYDGQSDDRPGLQKDIPIVLKKHGIAYYVLRNDENRSAR